MEFIIGVGGILGLTVFAAVFGIDIRALAEEWRENRRASVDNDDPNSTLSVTYRVVAELGSPETCS
jgi:hypothetical protein